MRYPNADALGIEFAGVKFRTAIGVGVIGMLFRRNVTPEEHAEILLRHVEAGPSFVEVPGRTIASAETLETGDTVATV